MTDERRTLSDHTWVQAREDYLAGYPGDVVCRRYGMKLRTLRERAAKEGWRRADQPDPAPLDEDDLSPFEAAEVQEVFSTARLRAVAATMRGNTGEALRWARLTAFWGAQLEDERRWIERDEKEALAHRERQILLAFEQRLLGRPRARPAAALPPPPPTRALAAPHSPHLVSNSADTALPRVPARPAPHSPHSDSP